MKKVLILTTVLLSCTMLTTPAFATEEIVAPAKIEATATIGMPETTPVFPADPEVIPEVSNDGFISSAVKTVGALITEVGTKEGWAKTIAIALAVLQLFYKFLGTPMAAGLWGKLAPNQRFITVAITSFATFLLTQLSMGVSFAAAALSSVFLIAVVDYFRKYYERFVEVKKA
nr:hypothetical protein CKG001_10250 [Bdellovibrio sp. CKG001]